MTPLSRHPMTLAWLALVAATLTVFALAEGVGGGRFASIGIVLIAAFKVRLVFLWFMELRSGAMPWRRVTETWVAAVTLILIAGVLLTGAP